MKGERLDSTTGDRPGKIVAMRGILRRILTWLLVGALSAIFIAVAAEWFIEVARDKGWYDDAGKTWDSAVSAVLAFVISPVPLAGISLLTGIVGGLWLDQLLLKRERVAPVLPPPDEHAALERALGEAYKALGMAVGDRSPLQHQLTVSAVEPLLLQMKRGENIAIPDLRQGGEEAGNLRTLLFLNYVSPTLRLLDFEETRRRAAEIVPSLNRMSLEQLRERVEPSGGLGQIFG